jgi:hypothetical protein
MAARPENEALSWERADRREFDRFYFNLHGERREDGFLVLGAGLYPEKRLADGYVVLVTGEEQRNLRFSRHADAGEGDAIGPLRWRTGEEGRSWRLELDENPIGLRFAVEWKERAPLFSVGTYESTDGFSAYEHWFQSGRYSGTMTIDGTERSVDGWFGQRDRSRGRRAVRERLGMHLWLQGQFAGDSVGLLFNLDRDAEPVHLAGAKMREDGGTLLMAELEHDLDFDEDLEMRQGRVAITYEDGSEEELRFERSGRGVYMAGGGYAGWHGVDHGPTCVESEVWALDGSRNSRELPLGLSDSLFSFERGGEAGTGIVESALTRSSSFGYKPGTGRAGSAASP